MKVYRSIQNKLLTMSLLTIFLVISGGVWLGIQYIKTRSIAMQRSRAEMVSRNVARNIKLLMLNNRWRELQILIDELQESDSSVQVRIIHPVSSLIVKSSVGREVGTKASWEGMVRSGPDPDAPYVAERSGTITVRHVMSILNIPACHKCHAPGEKLRGILAVDVSADVNKYIKELVYKHLFGFLLAFGLIALTLLYWGKKFIQDPLGEMVQAMRKVEAGDLTVRAPVKSDDEFGYLAKVFNTMIASLESARKKIEGYHAQQIDRAAKLASLGEMVSGIAHEIKNPLAGMTCAIQMLAPECKTVPGKQEHIAMMKEYISKLDGVVKNLLNYAKMKPPQFVPADIGLVLEKALFFLHAEAKKQNVVIHTRLESDPCTVVIDPDQIQQVFMNIILNAIQAMPKGGQLDISVGIRVSADVKDETSIAATAEQVLVARFRDAGEGIAPEDLQFIFVPFLTRKPQGTGLGLSISQRIIQEHGGEISVESTVGRGSVFTVYLPVRAEKEEVRDAG